MPKNNPPVPVLKSKPEFLQWDEEVQGLAIYTYPTRGQWFFFLGWDNSKCTIGEASTMTLSEARVEARRISTEIGGGIDPATISAEGLRWLWDARSNDCLESDEWRAAEQRQIDAAEDSEKEARRIAGEERAQEREDAYQKELTDAPGQWEDILDRSKNGDDQINKGALKVRLAREGFDYDGIVSAIRDSKTKEGDLKAQLMAVWEEWIPCLTWYNVLIRAELSGGACEYGQPLPEVYRKRVRKEWKNERKVDIEETASALGICGERLYTPTFELEVRPPPLWIEAAMRIAELEGFLPAEQTAPPEKESERKIRLIREALDRWAQAINAGEGAPPKSNWKGLNRLATETSLEVNTIGNIINGTKTADPKINMRSYPWFPKPQKRN